MTEAVTTPAPPAQSIEDKPEAQVHHTPDTPTIETLALEIIQRQAAQEEQASLDALLSELESLSDEDSEQLLSQAGDES